MVFPIMGASALSSRKRLAPPPTSMGASTFSNAGIQLYGDAVTTAEEEWDRFMGINLKG
jgi:hypothetical protein